jgi:hypothetical protein
VSERLNGYIARFTEVSQDAGLSEAGPVAQKRVVQTVA